ncbi:MAG: 30S ribosomal protein S9 [bacterium]
MGNVLKLVNFLNKAGVFLMIQVEKNMKKAQVKQDVFTIHGVGRRKKAVARVWLKKGGKGSILVNGREYGNYFDTDISRSLVGVPFKVTQLEKAFDAKVTAEGGGLKGQAEAVRLGIARALLAYDESLGVILRKNGLLTVDSRVKERKKYGQKGARKKFQFVKR